MLLCVVVLKPAPQLARKLFRCITTTGILRGHCFVRNTEGTSEGDMCVGGFAGTKKS